jgi:hypothetical protein
LDDIKWLDQFKGKNYIAIEPIKMAREKMKSMGYNESKYSDNQMAIFIIQATRSGKSFTDYISGAVPK